MLGDSVWILKCTCTSTGPLEKPAYVQASTFLPLGGDFFSVFLLNLREGSFGDEVKNQTQEWKLYFMPWGSVLSMFILFFSIKTNILFFWTLVWFYFYSIISGMLYTPNEKNRESLRAIPVSALPALLSSVPVLLWMAKVQNPSLFCTFLQEDNNY